MDTKVRVEDVIQEEELKMPLAIWIRRISSLELRTLNTRYQQLKQVYIERISHYRQDSAVAHELIILHLRSGNDTRIARLERLKLEQTPEGFCGQMENKKCIVSGHQTGNYDQIYITDSLDTALQGSTPYVELQHLCPPPHEVSVLDIAALASVIGDLAKDFSLFHHMCMWWSTVFFKTLCLETGVDSVPGPSFHAGGKIAGIPFVTSEGCLVFALEQLHSLDEILDTIPGDDLVCALQADIERLEMDADLVTPVERIVLHFLAKRKEIEDGFTRVIREDAAWLSEQETWRREGEELRGRQREELERQREELERQREELRERRREELEKQREELERQREELERQSEVSRRLRAECNALKQMLATHELDEDGQGGNPRDGAIRAMVSDLATAFWSGQSEIGI